MDDYNRYFLNQLYELLTEYGPVYEVWFDGANPDPSVKETYDYAAWYDLIRHLQPDAIIFGKGPDGRWVGNEGGVGCTTEWSVIPLPRPPESFNWPDMTAQDLGSREAGAGFKSLVVSGGDQCADTLWMVLVPDKRVRTAADLVDIYYQSVGRNGNWLLNLSPDNRGLIPDNELAPLRLMAQVVGETFAKNLTAGGTLVADNSNPANQPSLALDGNLDTWWEAAAGQTTATLTLKLPGAVTFDVVSLQEAVDHRGQSHRIVWRGCVERVGLVRLFVDQRGTDDHRGAQAAAAAALAGDDRPGAHSHHRFACGTDAGGDRAFQAGPDDPTAGNFRSRCEWFPDDQRSAGAQDCVYDRRQHAHGAIGRLRLAHRSSDRRHGERREHRAGWPDRYDSVKSMFPDWPRRAGK